ncbi:hypothetical protein [Deinococcus peraridilitoris]|uniref:hypothetical protein n=1 Tax=Deinococcus peraridilitoris TaxID=432329 RepID=UPI0002FDFDBB|nr:hypothetical protein [Deinococcus peraridilitoris]
MLLRFALACLLGWAGMGGPASAQVTLEESARTLSAQDNGRLRWSRTFEASAGSLVGPVTVGARTWLAVGPQLYAYGEQGQVEARIDLPSDAAALDESGGELRVTVRYGAVLEAFSVEGDVLRERVVFPPLESTTRWLERTARRQVGFDHVSPADARAALEALQAQVQRDPTNPFAQAFLATAALKTRQGDVAARATESALMQNVPFFVSVRLAQYFDSAGLPDAADRALQNARQSWAALGYDPALPVSRSALKAYGNPLGYLELLLGSGKLLRAEAWLRFMRDISPRFEGYRDVYGRYVGLLESQNRLGEAYEWRAFTRELSRGSLYGLGPDALLAVRDVSRWATFMLLLVLAATALALGARAWPLQGRDLAPLGGRLHAWRRHPLSRLRRILLSYWGFGEKLAFVALLGALLVSLCAWAWSARTYTRANAPALNFGTYGGAWFYDGLEQLGLEVGAPDARLVRGLGAQLDGDNATARGQYGVSSDPCVLNNLGVLLEAGGDEIGARERYRAALARNPNLSAPAYNLQLGPNTFEANFQRVYRSTPRLCYPTDRHVYRAVDGALSGELRQIVQNPWVYLVRFPSGLPRPLQWLWVSALLFTLGLAILWLFVPRPPGVRAAPRPWRFRLLCVVFPGVAFLDVAWGLVLQLIWGAAVVGGVAVLGGWRFPYLLDLSVGGASTVIGVTLALCYAINVALLLLDELRLAGERRRAKSTAGVARPS